MAGMRNEDMILTLLHNGPVDISGWSFHVIYGRHGHGYYIAIPNWGVCVEAAEPDNILYNAEQLRGCYDKEVARFVQQIAEEISRRVG